MNRKSFFSQFETLPYFTIEMIKASSSKYNINKRLFESYIYTALSNKEIIAFKRGFYVTNTFFEANRTNSSYHFYIANKLLSPSYISLESALQYYGLIPEAINFTHTSVTTSLPRKFENRLGSYNYRSISNDLFKGFQFQKDSFEFMIALPHKAVFDYLYYYTNRFTKNLYSDIFEDLRIDIEELSLEEKENLRKLISNFTSIKFDL